jgi:uncharacterized membrane protein
MTSTLDAQSFTYPPARKADVVDDYHGTRVADPYRWLEDVDSPETRSWVEAENRVTFAYLEQIPERERIRRRLTELWDYPKYGAPFQKGGRYFFFKNSGLQNQSVLYTQSSLTAEPQILLDPNTLSPDGTVALSILAFAEDGRTMVYGTSGSGSDWQEFRVRDVTTRQDRSDHLVARFGGSWPFIGIFGGILVTWMVVNAWVLVKQPFDPYPFILLNLVLSTLAALQAPVIMMSQNRQAEKDRLHAQQDYEVNLMAEIEIRDLHDKMDSLRFKQWHELWHIQKRQIELLEHLCAKQENPELKTPQPAPYVPPEL